MTKDEANGLAAVIEAIGSEQLGPALDAMLRSKLTFDMNGLARTDLYDGVEDVISAADFIELSEGAQVIFV